MPTPGSARTRSRTVHYSHRSELRFNSIESDAVRCLEAEAGGGSSECTTSQRAFVSYQCAHDALLLLARVGQLPAAVVRLQLCACAGGHCRLLLLRRMLLLMLFARGARARRPRHPDAALTLCLRRLSRRRRFGIPGRRGSIGRSAHAAPICD